MGRKRKTLALDEQLLEEALRIGGRKTYAATIELALRELVRCANVRRILELRGSDDGRGARPETRGDARSGRKGG